MVVADDDMGRQLPYALLDRIKDEFLRTYNDHGKIATAHSLDKAFGYVTVWGVFCDHPALTLFSILSGHDCAIGRSICKNTLRNSTKWCLYRKRYEGCHSTRR